MANEQHAELQVHTRAYRHPKIQEEELDTAENSQLPCCLQRETIGLRVKGV